MQLLKKMVWRLEATHEEAFRINHETDRKHQDESLKKESWIWGTDHDESRKLFIES